MEVRIRTGKGISESVYLSLGDRDHSRIFSPEVKIN